MHRITPIARIVLGLAFTAFGLNYFVPFLPTPAQAYSPEALQFLGAFVGSGLLALVKAIEVAAGLALLADRFVPLALALLAPVLVGITAFHALLAPAGIVVPVVLVALELVLAWGYRGAFAPMLRAHVAPSAVTADDRGRAAIAQAA